MTRNDTPLPLRRAIPADAERIAGLVNSAYRGESSRAGWTTEADLVGGQRTDVAMILALLAVPSNALLIHEDAAGIAAHVLLERTPDHAYLGMLTVRPTLQASGTGRRLLAAAEHFVLREWQIAQVEMTVLEQRPELIAWYGRRGYRWTGAYAPFPYGDSRQGAPTRDDLRFVVLRKSLADAAAGDAN